MPTQFIEPSVAIDFLFHGLGTPRRSGSLLPFPSIGQVMIRFRFQQSSCVAVGTFNIYILQPKLLVDMDVFEAPSPVPIAGDLTQPGIRFEVNNCKWIVRPDRLSVESEDADADCGSYIQRTLSTLCWTPIMAVGMNAQFEASLDSESKLPEELRLPSNAIATQRTIHLCIPDGQSKVNIQVSGSDDKLLLAVNRHMDFTALKDRPRELSEKVQEFCKGFLGQRAKAIEIAKDLIAGEFNYERNDIQSDNIDDEHERSVD